MKYKYAAIIFLIGIALNILGAFLKIGHYNYGSITGNVNLSIGLVLEVFGIILFLYQLFTSSKFKESLNG